jgi:hypothetical protein
MPPTITPALNSAGTLEPGFMTTNGARSLDETQLALRLVQVREDRLELRSQPGLLHAAITHQWATSRESYGLFVCGFYPHGFGAS